MQYSCGKHSSSYFRASCPPTGSTTVMLHLYLTDTGLAGALSRTATAPVDRLKMLLQVQEGKMMTIKEGMRIMAAEGEQRASRKQGVNCRCNSIT